MQCWLPAELKHEANLLHKSIYWVCSVLRTGSFILQRCFINFEESIYRPQLSTDYPKPNIMDIIQTTYKRKRETLKSHTRTYMVPEDFIREVKKQFKREKNEIWSGSGDSPANFEKSNYFPVPQQTKQNKH